MEHAVLTYDFRNLIRDKKISHIRFKAKHGFLSSLADQLNGRKNSNFFTLPDLDKIPLRLFFNLLYFRWLIKYGMTLGNKFSGFL